MKIVGIDPSLSRTGVAVIIDGRVICTDVVRSVTWPGGTPKRTPHTHEHRVDRMDEIVTEIVYWSIRADLVVIEGLAFDAHDTMRQLAGLSWVAQFRLRDLGYRVAIVPPSTVRTFAKLNARAAKDRMLARAHERFEGVEIEDDNAGDALWLAEIGAAWLGCPVLSDSPERLSLLRGVSWPAPDLAA